VRCGGGRNHRFGLDDASLIKDNHIVASGGVAGAVKAARAHAGHMVHIEVEVERLDQLEEALSAGANSILLDNMTPDQLREAVKRTAGRAVLEASGNVTAETIAAIAAAGVDLISSGAITHSAKNLDVGLDFKPV
jgi:nicotinate-nucleotide pyrophosphorylase (carboxylating)